MAMEPILGVVERFTKANSLMEQLLDLERENLQENFKAISMKEISKTGRSTVMVNIHGAMGPFMKETLSMVFQMVKERDNMQVHLKVTTHRETLLVGN